MKRSNLVLIVIGVSIIFLSSINAQITCVPNDNFEKALINLSIDTDGIVDENVATSDISGVKSIDIYGKYIGDLTGIEGFISLELLECYNNQLPSLAKGMYILKIHSENGIAIKKVVKR